jgi:predicted patatin/cPLA2 family phospholipase
MQTDCAENAPKEPAAATGPTIRHLVLSGGGMIFVQFYSALKHSHLGGRWTYGHIRSTFTTSAGSIAWLLACLAYHLGWDLVDNFLVNRPWHTVCGFSVDNVFKAYGNIGLFGRKLFDEVFSPLFAALDLPMDITLSAFHDFAGGVDMHFMTTDIQTYATVDLSHSTHPDWLLLDAVYASAALPVLLQPFQTETGELYADGALLCNYPIDQCLKSGAKAAEILGIYKIPWPIASSAAELSDVQMPYNNLLSYVADIMTKSVCSHQTFVHVANEIVCGGEHSMVLTAVYDICKSRDLRLQELEKGAEAFRSAVEVSKSLQPTPETTP